MRRGAADQAGVGFHWAEGQPAAGEDGLVRLVHLPVALLCAGFVGVERVGVLHDELAPAHQPEARPDLVPELGLDLVEVRRELPVGADLAPHQVGDHFLVRRPEAEVPLVPVLEPEELLAIEVPAPGLLPELRRRGDRHEDLLRPRLVQLFADDAFDLPNDTQAQREVRVDAGGDLADHAGAQHQPVADDLRFPWILPEGGNQQLRLTH